MDTFIPKGSVWKNFDLGREAEEPMIEGTIFVGFQVKNRGERILTSDLFVPNEARYQTALHLD